MRLLLLNVLIVAATSQCASGTSGASFYDGEYSVPRDMPRGTYHTDGTDSGKRRPCSWSLVSTSGHYTNHDHIGASTFTVGRGTQKVILRNGCSWRKL